MSIKCLGCGEELESFLIEECPSCDKSWPALSEEDHAGGLYTWLTNPEAALSDCKGCGNEIKEMADVCPFCMRESPAFTDEQIAESKKPVPMPCKGCGEVVTSDLKTCPHCTREWPVLSDEQIAELMKPTLFPCEGCGEEVTSDLKTCPHCMREHPIFTDEELIEFKKAESEELLISCEGCGKEINVDLDVCPYCMRKWPILSDEKLAENNAAIGLSSKLPASNVEPASSSSGISSLIWLIIAGISIYFIFSTGSEKKTSSTRSNPITACQVRGIQYFTSINSYPRLSDGRDARKVALERCLRTTTAF